MKIQKTILSSCAAAVFALSFTACSKTSTTTTANTANKPANTATVTNTANTTSSTTTTNANSTASAAGATTTEGDMLKIDEAGIMMNVPKGFKFSKDGDDTVVKTDDEGVDIRFTVPKDNDYNKVVSEAAQEIDDYLKDVKIEDKGSKVDVNGMEATSMSGTAKDEDGEDVMWDLTIINAPKKPVLANIYAEKGSLQKHQAEVQSFLKSVKKM